MARRVPFTGGEKQSLHVSLDRHRDAVLWKLEGLDDTNLRRAMTPSGTNLLGLVKHLAAVEYGWFCETFGRETEPLPFDDQDPDADLRVRPEETTQDVLAFYGRARAAADRVIDELDLDATGTAWFGEAVSLRWVLIHMVEETARHAGHVDIVRELIDGMTGDHRPRDPCGRAMRSGGQLLFLISSSMFSMFRTRAKSRLNASSADVVPGTVSAASIFLIRWNIRPTVSLGLAVPVTVSPSKIALS